MHRVLSTAALVAVVVPAGAFAAEVKVDRIEIVDTGIYTLVLGEETADSSMPSETIVAVETADLVEPTTEVVARLGLEFGLRYRVVGEPDGSAVTLDFLFAYPPPGLADPEQRSPLLESRFTRERTIGEIEYTGFGFESDWEIVPGTWTIAISHEGETLAEQSFTVTVE